MTNHCKPSVNPIELSIQIEKLTLSSHSRAGLDLPCPVLDLGELESFEHFTGLQSQVKILLVGENEEWQLGQLFLAEQLLQGIVALLDSFLISRVDDIDDTVSAIIVVLPVWSDCLLAANIPHVKFEAVLSLKILVSNFVFG